MLNLICLPVGKSIKYVIFDNTTACGLHTGYERICLTLLLMGLFFMQDVCEETIMFLLHTGI